MSFNFGEILAKGWGVEYGSDEYKAKHKAMRKRNRETPVRFTIAPCGPPCDVCGDNSYTCGHG